MSKITSTSEKRPKRYYVEAADSYDEYNSILAYLSKIWDANTTEVFDVGMNARAEVRIGDDLFFFCYDSVRGNHFEYPASTMPASLKKIIKDLEERLSD